MSVDEQQKSASRSRRNRLVGWGLGLVALLLYAAIALRWTHGF